MVSPEDGARNVRVISASNLLTGTYNNLLQVVLQPFVVRLTGSVVVLSILQGLATRMGGVVGSLSQLAGGHLADRWGRRPMMLLASGFNMTSLSLFVATALTMWWPLLVPSFLFLGLGLMSSPASQSMVAESVAVRGRAMAYSKVLFFLILPAAFIAFLGGFLADRFGYALIFALSLGLEGTNLVLFVLLLRETFGGRDLLGGPLRRLARLRQPPLRGLLIVACVDTFAWTISSMIIYGMVVEEFGFTDTDIGILVGIWAVVFAGTTLPMGKLVERLGSRWPMFLSEIFGIPVMLGWIVSQSLLEFSIVAVFNGLTASTWVPAWQTVVANSVEDESRGEVTGQLTAVRGFFAFPAPILGGALYAAFGYPAPMIASFFGALLAAALVLRYVPAHRTD